MINSRERIGAFFKENFKDGEFGHDSTVTREMEPRLKYFMVDRYFFEVISHESINKLIGFVNSLWDVEIYFAFEYLCIGYTDEYFGKGKDCMRLDAFVPVQPCDLNDLTDRVFVTVGLPAGDGIQDKPGNVDGVV